ncbi:hypothetical protein GYMLUDRAFT_237141 [Collybiopsis luxurians FD-317 M1]|nr:hypothetical protein GYMLUDRAFT_237141 [Collybiopsis luxurians FD-317 M1]
MSFMALKNPRKSHNRASLLVFLSLIFISSYIFFVQRPALSSNHGVKTAPPTLAQALDAMRNSKLADGEQHQKPFSNQPQIMLNSEQELATISSFLASQLPMSFLQL